MEVPCKRHNRSLQSPRATMPTPLSGFTREFPSPSPFCDFRICERGSLPLNHDRISDLCPSTPNGKRERTKIQPFRPYRAIAHRILALTTGFGVTRSKCVERRVREWPA
ncbi:hypothetical protein AVEN_39517-1 [Araneus ventricosus]|uniref:Uncharacterized protein n=1 Tax=Araneus ventricosus TaxID=182803 RepID=A0A4Y2QXC5_ARAVE|nr:hypothetical protein AVEN_39517-1 [Araneus ventricosus]